MFLWSVIVFKLTSGNVAFTDINVIASTNAVRWSEEQVDRLLY